MTPMGDQGDERSGEVPIHLHSHFTSGMSPMTHLKAIEAGVDIIDTCMTPYAYRTSHAAVEPLVMTLLGTNGIPASTSKARRNQ
jgi:pyruvate/oxaloacetate carboxyltransferase